MNARDWTAPPRHAKRHAEAKKASAQGEAIVNLSIAELQSQLRFERSRRADAERQVEELQNAIRVNDPDLAMKLGFSEKDVGPVSDEDSPRKGRS